MTKKEFSVLFKFSDVSQTIEAESLEEAQKKALGFLDGEQTPQNDTYCYGTEVEEVKD